MTSFSANLFAASLSVLVFSNTGALAQDSTPQTAGSCGIDVACPVANGEYYLAMPDDYDGSGPVGAIMFFHGWRGRAANEMANKSLRAMANRLGVAFIAPQGANDTWSFPGSPTQIRDEIAFIDAVLDDATTRFQVNPDRIMASGFSMGGSMVWYLACDLGERFAGFAPIAGAFWEPQPQDCSGPMPKLFHVHGTADRTVPIEGRPIGSAWRQGNVISGLDMWLHKGGADKDQAERIVDGRLTCSRYDADGGLIELCLHEGGHSVRSEWIERAWNALMAANGWS